MTRFKIAACLLFGLLLSCASDLRLMALDFSATQGKVVKTAILRLPSGAYPMFHNIHPLKTVQFPELALAALQEAVAARRKAWKVVYPANVDAADPGMAQVFVARKSNWRGVTPEETERMQKLSSLLETRYCLVIESISLKDVSTPQAPANLVIGACLQMWDLQKGSPAYMVRGVSRTVYYGDENARKAVDEALADLFRDLLSPLPKN